MSNLSDEQIPGANEVYDSLLSNGPSRESLQQSQFFLDKCLSATATIENTLPATPQGLLEWVRTESIKVGSHFSEYQQQRVAGQRQYFQNRSQGLSYLRQITPTKLVDGSWLYPVLEHWQDTRFLPLIQTYVEELGDGVLYQNHVLMFQKLLQTYGCEEGLDLQPDCYLQGAIQLSLGLNKDTYLPELIGYNLGYELPPLHILITAHEMKELGVDPYYFTVHIAGDNASTGHAYKAAQAVIDLAAGSPQQSDFYQRVLNGYELNQLGPAAQELISRYDLEAQLVDMLQRKSEFGRNVHPEGCRIGGKALNDWLRQPEDIPEFLQTLEQVGWVKRHQDPANSRFWGLLDGPKAVMLGVFSPFEAQLLYDWIGGNWVSENPQDYTRALAQSPVLNWHKPQKQEIERHQLPVENSGANSQVKVAQQELRGLSGDALTQRLITLMAPSTHFQPAGLLATKKFRKLIYA